METTSKKEQIELRHQAEKARELVEQRKRKLLTGGAIFLGILIVVLFFVWLIKESSKPLPGVSYKDEGSKHVQIGERVTYKTNPPNSGNHYAEWTKAGIYDNPVQDEYLVHSLEHGYIVIFYNCEKIKVSKADWPPKVYAHGDEVIGDNAAQVNQNKEEPIGPQWQTSECKELKEQLKKIADENRIWKLIVMPRHSLDTTIALTAWTRLDKFGEFDKKRIEAFINAFRDHGPEKTTE